MSLSGSDIQFPEVRVVEASAGSGKTYTLAKRYIQLLMRMKAKKQSLPIRSILAITFTNKAMHEMRARIISFLKQIALDDFSSEQIKVDLISSLGLDENLAREYAFELMDQIIKDYNFFNIQTIDGFVKSLLASSAYEMNLSAGFDIKQDYSQLLEYSLDICIDRSAQNIKVKSFFDNFIDQYLFIENRLGWSPKRDILAILDSLTKVDHSYSGKFVVFNRSMEQLKEKKAIVLNKIKQLHKNLPDKTHAAFRKSLDKFVLEHEHGFDIDSTKFLAKDRLPLNKGGVESNELQVLWNNIQKNLSRICEDEAQTIFNCYIELYKLVNKELRITVAKHDSLLLGELNKQAKRLFSENVVSIADVYYRMSSRFKHYMIDEFQDTSYLRWKNIMPMVEEALSQGGTLFYVGDKKQAIYRFSGGDIRLFDYIADLFSDYNVKRDLLKKNYRSQADLVRSNNRLFSIDNIRQMLIAYNDDKKDTIFCDDDQHELLNVFESSEQEYNQGLNGGYVYIEKLEADNLKDETYLRDKVVELVKDLNQRFAYSEIAILCRSNSSVEEISSWLLADAIPVASDCTLNIRENHIIKELLRLLKFLSAPIDDSSFASFLLGEIFCVASDFQRIEIESFIFNFKSSRKDRAKYLYIEFREKYPSLWTEYFEELYRSVGFVPIYELVVSIYQKFDLVNRMNSDQGFLMHFLELLKDCESEHIDLASFIDYFENSAELNVYVKVSHADAVSVMTVHKSKGLEFNALIIPLLVMDAQVSKAGTNTYDIVADESELRLIKLKKDYGRFSKDLDKLYKKRMRESFSDELNNVYVALTRPKEELYVFIPPKSGNSGNPARYLIKEDIYEYGKINIERKPVLESADSSEVLEPSVYTDWISKLKNEFASSQEIKSREQVIKGDLYHKILENIKVVADCSILDDHDLMSSLCQKNKDIQIDVIDNIRKFLLDENINRMLFDGCLSVCCEKEFVNFYGDSKRMDRLNFYADKLVLIDYKSSCPVDDSKHRTQITDYVGLLKDIYPDSKIEGYLLYIEDVKIMKVC